ncbi:TrmH family RNA methyltransferase [Jhaorihella thermophila]
MCGFATWPKRFANFGTWGSSFWGWRARQRKPSNRPWRASVSARSRWCWGAEGPGLRAKTRDTVDKLVRIDSAGPFGSLNVSNAAAVALYAARR